MTTTLKWTHAGPTRQTSMKVPGVSLGLDDDTLVFDEKRKKVLYLFEGDDPRELEAWMFDGRAWERSPGKSTTIAGENHHRQSYFDPTRGGVVVWGVEYVHELKRYVPTAVIADESGVRELVTTGDIPLLEPEDDEDFYVSHSFALAMTFDRKRDVAVCLTRRGIWELDAKGAWKKRSDGAGLIPQEWRDDGGGVFDPLRNTCLLWVHGSHDDDDQHLFFDWNGDTLTRLAMTGLPKDSCSRFSDAYVDFAPHPKHGVVAFVSAVGLFAFDGKRWTALPKTNNLPPRRSDTNFAYDPARDLYVQGPGEHEEDPGAFGVQRVFYVLRDGTWEEQGVVVRPSVFEKMSHAMHGAMGSNWYAVGHNLRTLAWEKDAWREVIDEKRGAAMCPKGDYMRGMTATPDGLVAVTSRGSVLSFAGKTWKLVGQRSPLWKDRSHFTLGYDEGANRLVAWGGEVKHRKSNDTFFFDGKKWTQAKAPSPQPKDFKDNFVYFAMTYDHALGRLVRFGMSDVAVLEGDVWKSFTPKSYRELGGQDARQHLPAHDRATGETLLINLESGRVARFDLAECKEVGVFAFPADVVADAARKKGSGSYHLRDNIVFVPETRTLEAQHDKDAAGRYSISLAAAFEAAKNIGPRKLLGAPEKSGAAPISTQLYFIDKSSAKFWFATVEGKSLTRAWGKIGDKGETKKETFKSVDDLNAATQKLVAEKKREGYVGAAALSMKALEGVGTQTSSELTTSRKQKEIPNHAVSRVGGLPSGVPLSKWPKSGSAPMGFLFQLKTGSLLKKHAGIAVFCTTDGTATEDQRHNHVVLLTAAELAKAPPSSASEHVPVLEPTLITIKEPRPEIHEELVDRLAERDAAMGAAFDRFQEKAKVGERASSKIGGAPKWVQDDATPKNCRFVAQLDFDSLDLRDEWDDAGLNGVIFVFVSDDEKKGIAFWQYT